MNEWRVELRIFGLLAVALTFTAMLYLGLSSADVQGKVLGLQLHVAGPLAGFVAVLLVFWLMGLFAMGFEREVVSSRPIENLSREEVERELEDIVIQAGRIERRRKKLEQYAQSLAEGKTGAAAWASTGIRPATRQRRKTVEGTARA